MRTAPWLAVVGLTFALFGVPLFGQPDRPDAPARPALPTTPAADLPLKRVVLFTAGVGYFRREGSVEGTARVTLKAPEEDVNDLIKTLTAADLDGGAVRVITLDNRALAEVTLKAFAVDLTENPTVGQLLLQVRGERVEVTDAAGATVTGSIVSVQPPAEVLSRDGVPVPAGDGERVTLLTDDGVQTVALAKAKRVRFASPALQAEFWQALQAMAAARGGATKGVTVTFAGNGKRRVALGYVTEAPLWKPAYRLTLAPAGASLQGWAAVENTTEEDWSDVAVKLVSGRPMTFRMDLHDPLFVPRPTVEPDLFASLRPPVYQPDTGAPPPGMGIGGFGGGFGGGRFGGSGFQGVGHGGVGYDPSAGLARPSLRGLVARRLSYDEFRQRKNEATKPPDERPDRSSRPDAAINTANLGEAFEYTVAEPVSLPRLKTALLPVVAGLADVARVSIYNPSVLLKHPLLGARLTNGKQFLAQGPVAVFDGDTFAGDARLPDVKPGETRLLSYAIDLTTHARTEERPRARSVTGARVGRGWLEVVERHRDAWVYTFRNAATEPRTVLVTHRVRAEWKLVAPDKPAERTPDFYRFEVKVPAGDAATLEVAEESTVPHAYNLTSELSERLEEFRALPATPPAVKAALAGVLADRARLDATRRALAGQETVLKAVVEEQARIRANIERVPKESDAFKRYLKKFDDQETQIEAAQARVRELTAEAEKQSRAMAEMIKGLKVE